MAGGVEAVTVETMPDWMREVLDGITEEVEPAAAQGRVTAAGNLQ